MKAVKRVCQNRDIFADDVNTQIEVQMVAVQKCLQQHHLAVLVRNDVEAVRVWQLTTLGNSMKLSGRSLSL